MHTIVVDIEMPDAPPPAYESVAQGQRRGRQRSDPPPPLLLASQGLRTNTSPPSIEQTLVRSAERRNAISRGHFRVPTEADVLAGLPCHRNHLRDFFRSMVSGDRWEDFLEVLNRVAVLGQDRVYRAKRGPAAQAGSTQYRGIAGDDLTVSQR